MKTNEKILLTTTIVLISLIGTLGISYSENQDQIVSETQTIEFLNSTSLSVSDFTSTKSSTSPNFHRVEILSKEIIDTFYVDGTKVTKIKETIRLIEKPTLQDLIQDNQKYFDYLELEFGEEGKKIVNLRIQELNQTIANMPEEMTVDLIKLGEHSILFDVFTRDGMMGNIKDPVNFLFWNNGQQDNVHSVIKNNALHNWDDVFSLTQYVLIDNTAHGGSAEWRPNFYQLTEGTPLEQYHVRVFDGGYDTHNEFAEWSLGAVHYEKLEGVPPDHVIQPNGWDLGEAELRNDLTGQLGVGFIDTDDLQNNIICCQGIDHDGIATKMELTNTLCFVPTEVDWVVTSDCNLISSATAPLNVVVKNNSVVTIDPGVNLTIDFANYNLTIEFGSGVLIKSTGSINSP